MLLTTARRVPEFRSRALGHANGDLSRRHECAVTAAARASAIASWMAASVMRPRREAPSSSSASSRRRSALASSSSPSLKPARARSPYSS